MNHTMAPQRLVYGQLEFISSRVAVPPSAYAVAVDNIYDEVANEIFEQFVAPHTSNQPRFQFLESFAKAIFAR